MEKEFVPYEQALALKELGLEVDFAFGHYNYNTRKMRDYICKRVTKSFFPAPLYQQAFRWFREKYSLDKIIDSWTEQPVNNEIWDKAYQYYINGEAYHPYFKTYEEAELECLKKLIEIVKNDRK